MRKYVLDTQLLVRAIRNPEEAERLDSFLSASNVFLSSVVAKELLAGARAHELRELRREFLNPFVRRNRVTTPSHTGWTQVGDIMRKLRKEGFQITPALTNDALIAVSAAQVEAMLLHDNERDFRAIQRHYPRLQHTRVETIPPPAPRG